MSELDRDALKSAIHPALHELDVRINGLDVDGCHCNLVAEVVIDTFIGEVVWLSGRVAELTRERDEARAALTELAPVKARDEALRPRQQIAMIQWVLRGAPDVDATADEIRNVLACEGCRACPPGCRDCSIDTDCECYTHQDPGPTSVGGSAARSNETPASVDTSRVFPEEAAYWTDDADGDPVLPSLGKAVSEWVSIPAAEWKPVAAVIEAAKVVRGVIQKLIDDEDEETDWTDEPLLTPLRNFLAAVDALSTSERGGQEA